MRTGRLAVTIDDVRAAHEAIRDAVVRTPISRSQTLSAITGADVWIKFENLQYTASFKERGARNRLLQLEPEQATAGVVAMSAGNHAQAVAHHATLLGIRSTVVMPIGTPATKISATEDNGARVVLAGADLDEAKAVALRIAEEDGATFIPPYDDPAVIAGQGTCTLEVLEDAPPLDALLVPVGGGGLFAGACIAARAVAPEVELIGVQSELNAAMRAATGRPVEPPDPTWGPTIAEGIAVKSPGRLTREIIDVMADDVVAVPERLIEEAVVWFLELEKTVAEGAGAAPLAALLHEPERFAGRTVGLLLSGGNIDLRLLSGVIMRGLARTGRLCRLVIEVPDTPGALGELTAAVGRAGGNIIDLWHHREFGVHSARVTEIELLVETRDGASAEVLERSLASQGYVVDDVPRRARVRADVHRDPGRDLT
ncbi:MAG TPA: threonine ammonia-lyase [Acidimicrobiales bacterium]|nr:threonine ammonia-lyase [Acidimicrobiales bacterium]